MMANMLKSLIENERITTTLVKAKELRRHADRMITLAKRNTLSSKRDAIARMHIVFNPLTTKEARKAKAGDKKSYMRDRLVINKLFGPLKERYGARQGGYTRIIQKDWRIGDNAPTCYIEYVK
jgi:large subunit ribosomal protein L17